MRGVTIKGYRLVRDKRGISNAIIALILIALGIAIAATAYKYVGSIKPARVTSASLDITDDPDDIAHGTYAIDIKMVTGNPILLAGLKLQVYKIDPATGRPSMTYSKKIMTDRGNYAIMENGALQTDITKSDGTLNPGDVLLVKKGAGFNRAGNYIVEIYDRDTLIAKRTVYVS